MNLIPAILRRHPRPRLRVSVALRMGLAALVLLCTAQALYWPLLLKPGTQLQGWQVHGLAQIGYVVGAPVMALSLWLNGRLLVLAAVLWSACLYGLTGRVCKSPSNSEFPGRIE